MEQQDLIEKIQAVLRRNEAVRGAWLSGSFGRGDADRFSDIDMTVLVEEDRLEDAFSSFCAATDEIAPALFSKTLPHARTVNVITAEWLRYDLNFVTENELLQRSADSLKRLFDLDGVGGKIPARREQEAVPGPAALADIVGEFLRVLALMPVVMHRNELVAGQVGSGLLRDMLVKIMVHENDPQPKRGALSLSRSLRREQVDILNGLPPLCAEKGAIIAFNKEVAEHFLPRARGLAEKLGASWPGRFEQAALAYLRDSLGMEIDCGRERLPVIETYSGSR